VATELIGRCAYFRTERLTLAERAQVHGRCDGDTFEVWGVLDGHIRVEWDGEPLEVDAVGWVLLPAVLGPYIISAEAGATLLRVITPEPAH
jgi:mannose-6-phosphate isomerase